MEGSGHGHIESKIAWLARAWRRAEKMAIGDKTNSDAQRAEYHARQRLREAIDIAERGRCTGRYTEVCELLKDGRNHLFASRLKLPANRSNL